MSSSAASAATTRATYGNWIRYRPPGLLGAGLLGTGVLLGGMTLTMLVLITAGFTAALVMFFLTVVAFTLTGTSVGRTLTRRIAYTRSRQRREHQWRSGLFSVNATSRRLPGMLGKTHLLEKTDPFGQPFAVIKHARLGGLYTIVGRCVSEGPWMQDQERIDGWVGGFARVLSSCGQEPGIVCAKAITDTAPDPGGRLGAMVNAMRAKGSPAVARQIMDECVADYPAASSQNVTYVELTFRGKVLSRKGDEASILTELARKVPQFLGQLTAAGGGSVDMVTADELAAIVRVGYDPASQTYLEQAELAGVTNPVSWAEAGPVASQDLWDGFLHDSGYSVTYEMQAAPRSTINELAMSGLLAPHRDFLRKRVAMIYRPHSPDDSTKVSEMDANTAIVMAKQTKKRTSAVQQLTMRASEQTRQEVASGAVLVRLSMLITATVATGEDAGEAMAQADSTVRARAGSIPVRVRRSYGSQAAAFAATLPVGFVPWEHTAVPDQVREWM